jgi:SNF2 family DNA or RNA helicase
LADTCFVFRNLQIANHVIFLSSLVIDTQYKYESTHTQAIGRVHRRGQEKAVHVYHFLAAQTIDVNILEERESKTLVQRGERHLLLAEDEIEEGDKQDLAGAPFEGAACSMDN